MNKQKLSFSAFQAQDTKIQVLGKNDIVKIKGGVAAGDPPPFGID